MPTVLGIPTYPLSKDNDPQKGDKLVTMGEYVGESASPMGKNHNFIEVESGNHVILSGGALNWRAENGSLLEGEVFDIIYEGKQELTKGKWAGKNAHTFEVAKYGPEELPPNFKPRAAAKQLDVVAAVAVGATAQSSEALDDLE